MTAENQAPTAKERFNEHVAIAVAITATFLAVCNVKDSNINQAMDRVAELTKKTRDETFVGKLPSGKLVNMTPAIFSLGGATMDNEWNHLQQKLLRGLGVIAIENQARI